MRGFPVKGIMKMPMTYIASKMLAGAAEPLRQLSFTRWLSPDLRQASVDFCRNIGLTPIYGETSPDHQTRYLFWKLPQGAGIEVRTGRTKEGFEEFDRANAERTWKLLSLHINESDVYSAVWISPNYFETAKTFLAAHGITVADRRAG